MGEIRGQVAVAVLVQLVDVDLIDLEEGRAADRGPDGAHDLGVRVSRVPECSRLARSLAGGVPRRADAEHQERAIEHAKNQQKEDGHDQRKLSQRLAASVATTCRDHDDWHYGSQSMKRHRTCHATRFHTVGSDLWLARSAAKSIRQSSKRIRESRDPGVGSPPLTRSFLKGRRRS